MPKRLSSTEVIRILHQHVFTFVTQRGSHAKYQNTAGRIAIVPHPKKELPIGTTRSIFRQSGLTPVDFWFLTPHLIALISFRDSCSSGAEKDVTGFA